uniref:G-protein coupled receptors family 1 profile domain-containing protein n=2 Tax=Photinus pyralis TaxID=7054 RepID=A0A1Y1LW40_PHOPY
MIEYLCHENWSHVGPEYENIYTVTIMFLQYIIPFSVLLFTYTSIAIVIWCHRIPGEAENSRDQRIAKSKRKMVKMMVTVVFVFSACWLPFNILWVVQESISDQLKPYLWFALHWLAMSHACYNPIIYCYMNSRFRAGFIRAFRIIPCFRRCLPSFSMLHPKNTSFPLTSMEKTESSLLHRSSTSKTLNSTRRSTIINSTASCKQLSAKSTSFDVSNDYENGEASNKLFNVEITERN